MGASAQALLGQVLDGTWELVRVIGQGAYGTVYEGRDRRDGAAVAVKVLRPGDHDAFRRFRQEAEITSSLGSPHIARVHDFNVDARPPYLVLELLEGEDLGARLKRGPLSLGEALAVCEQVAIALGLAHRHKIVHRDLKPQNIFLARGPSGAEVVKVIDFGISKVLAASMSTSIGTFVGTPLYMSPEQAVGDSRQIDERSDVYALGAVLYEAIGGRVPYTGKSVWDVLEKVTAPELPTPLREIDPSVPAAVDQAIRRAMAKDREQRPRTITDFYNELAHAVRGAGREAPPPPVLVGGSAGGAAGELPLPLAGRFDEERAWRFLAFALDAMSGGARGDGFREAAMAAAATLLAVPGPTGELAAACARGDLAAALAALRGWTLAAVERVERVAVDGDEELVHHVDFSGPDPRGTPRRATVSKSLRVGPWVYLARFAEGIVVPLEPHLRRRLCPVCGARELFWAERLVKASGPYRGVASGHLLP